MTTRDHRPSTQASVVVTVVPVSGRRWAIVFP